PFRGGKSVGEPTAPRRIKVTGGQLRNIKLNPPTDIDWYTAIVTTVPGSGPVLLAHRVREKSRYGDLMTGYPWSPLRIEVSVPSAAQNEAVVVRRAATS
ncbi:MAG: hypothetical protein ABF312_06500, partial [Candidatus Nanopelagicales bacterium]